MHSGLFRTKIKPFIKTKERGNTLPRLSGDLILVHRKTSMCRKSNQDALLPLRHWLDQHSRYHPQLHPNGDVTRGLAQHYGVHTRPPTLRDQQ